MNLHLFVCVVGSDDNSCKLYDIRSDQAVASYSQLNLNYGIAAVSFSRSGRLLFVACDFDVLIWDTLKSLKVTHCFPNLLTELLAARQNIQCQKSQYAKIDPIFYPMRKIVIKQACNTNIGKRKGRKGN